MIDLTVFDLAGRRMRNLVEGELAAGRYTFTWDGRAQDGGRAAPGIYVARLTSPRQSLTRRITLLP
jgi:flagellar hook assembly protein FlgD